MARMQEGTTLIFVNRLDEAEVVFRRGMEGGELLEGDRDVRGSFGLQYAMASVIKGIASLSDDQLDECRERLFEADELVANSTDPDWVGKSVIRGVCTLMGGVTQCAQHSFVKGVWNVLRSWQWIKRLQSEALHFEGHEKDAVRSAALFTLAVFNLLISLLPPSRMKAAQWVSGFEGDRALGIGMLEECWKEGGLLAPWSALVLCSYHVDVKTFLGETQTAEDFSCCAEIIEWARERYPGSVFFQGLEADLCAAQKDIARATELSTALEGQVGELRALQWVLCYKRGMYALTDLQLSAAAEFFRASLQVYVEVGRRSMVPFMAMYSGICFHAAADQVEGGLTEGDAEALRASAGTMVDMVGEYEAMDKKNWGRQDRWAFETRRRYTKEATSAPWPLLDIAEAMVLRMRCVRWMQAHQAEALLQQLREKEDITLNKRVRTIMCMAEICRQQERAEECREYIKQGLALEPELPEAGKKHGALHMLQYLKAALAAEDNPMEAQEVVRGLEEYSKQYPMSHEVMFKVTLLKKRIGADFLDVYKTCAVKNTTTVTAVVMQVGAVVKWDWMLEAHDCSFRVVFTPSSGEPLVIQELDRHPETDGPVTGQYTVETPGRIQLVWDNSHSWMRSKTVTYHLQPDDLPCEVHAI